MKVFRLPLLFLLSGAIPSLPLAEEPPGGNSLEVGALNDAVAFLSGMPLPHATDHPLTTSGAWQRHVETLDRDFQSHRERVLMPMSAWSAAEIPPVLITGRPVRYLFSGPDFLHVYHTFPAADSFILCGLEPVGEFPDLARLDEATVAKALKGVEDALSEIINFSFFRTEDMKVDLVEAMFSGTTPVIAIFLARSGQYLKDLEFYKLSPDGTLASLGVDPEGADAVRIEFAPFRVQRTKTLYYFCTDLSDSGFESSGFRTWLEGQPTGNAYLKAASFLMHRPWFGKVRGHLLEHSYQVVGDDSGIPFRFFDPETWEAYLYGVYDGPIELFGDYVQADLKAAYDRARRPLAFGTGYKWRRGESNLMRFVRRDAPTEATEAATPEAGGLPQEEFPIHNPATAEPPRSPGRTSEVGETPAFPGRLRDV